MLAKPARGGKSEPRSHPGVFVGMLKSSSEAVVVTKQVLANKTRAANVLDDLVPQMMEQLGEGPEMVSRFRIQRRTAEEIVDMPIFKVFSQDRVRLRLVEQNIEHSVEIKVPKIPSQESVEAGNFCLLGAKF